jgi:hypothetical protein
VLVVMETVDVGHKVVQGHRASLLCLLPGGVVGVGGGWGDVVGGGRYRGGGRWFGGTRFFCDGFCDACLCAISAERRKRTICWILFLA